MTRIVLLATLLLLSLGSLPAAIIRIVASGESPPEGNGVFGYRGFLGSFPSAYLNEGGAIVFEGRMRGTTGGSSDDEGIYQASGRAIRTLLRVEKRSSRANPSPGWS